MLVHHNKWSTYTSDFVLSNNEHPYWASRVHSPLNKAEQKHKYGSRRTVHSIIKSLSDKLLLAAKIDQTGLS